jgi:hypothetical protein
MKTALVFLAVLIGSISGMAVTISGPAHAVVYCQYIDYPANCVARPGVRLVARPAVCVRQPSELGRPLIAAVPLTVPVAAKHLYVSEVYRLPH